MQPWIWSKGLLVRLLQVEHACFSPGQKWNRSLGLCFKWKKSGLEPSWQIGSHDPQRGFHHGYRKSTRLDESNQGCLLTHLNFLGLRVTTHPLVPFALWGFASERVHPLNLSRVPFSIRPLHSSRLPLSTTHRFPLPFPSLTYFPLNFPLHPTYIYIYIYIMTLVVACLLCCGLLTLNFLTT